MYRHGSYTSEVPTSLVPPANSTASLPVVFGTAPINQSKRETAPVNEPVLCYTYKEAIEALGYSSNFNDYTLCEFMSSHFSLYAQAPVVFVNVLSPEAHKKSGTPATLTVTKGKATLAENGVLLDSLVIKSDDGSTTYAKDQDYVIEFDDNGHINLFFSVSPDISSVQAEFEQLDPTMVSGQDIIGGVSPDGRIEGLELVNQIFSRFRLVPGQILAPKYSTDSAVAAVMAAKASNINGLFKAVALIDISTSAVSSYTEVPAHKNDNNLTSPYQFPCWPKVSLGGTQYHFSTQLASVICRTDVENEDIPYVSPSNKNLQADSAVLEDGSEVYLGVEQANYLNGEGITTALNFIGGWKVWGNRTGAYPGETDPKNTFISVRKMMNWIQNQTILTCWQKVDDPTNKRLIETVVDSMNVWLNGLSARGFILGGRIEFVKPENPLTSLIDGKVTFHIFVTPPTPGKELNFLVEFDPNYFDTLFPS
ncbi:MULTISPECIES: phage tail sheath family protein [Pontibacillus]|uniref:Phage tail sheath family protein n=1 Tax=Pontibacillus chungwhensis TaxID=265426 RepID=A0ABY8UYJ0_9BACI|nr:MULTISPECIES: phage tail sheath family protein [Pontibacillus]MCD5324776.1 phage tail sheath family protein [Pontibacillus sp. HN14]WIF98736.1 phage tail sheath family protein [Pontibacillus chungwhensis]